MGLCNEGEWRLTEKAPRRRGHLGQNQRMRGSNQGKELGGRVPQAEGIVAIKAHK